MEAFGFSNTILPVVLLLALAVFLPVLTVSPRVASQGALARGMGVAVLLVLLLGAVLFAELYRREGHDVLGAFVLDPVGRSLFFLTRSGMAAMFWGPILAFVWFGRALEVERRKGAARARQERLP